MKDSLARKITVPFFLIFMLLTFVLAGVGYLHVRHSVLDQVQTDMHSNVVDLETRLTDYTEASRGAFIDEFHKHALEMCDSYNLVYIAISVPFGDLKEAKYLAVVENDGILDPEKIEDTGSTLGTYLLEGAEYNVWNGSKDFDFFTWDADDSNEIGIVTKIKGPDNTDYLLTVDKSVHYINTLSRNCFTGMAAVILLLFVLMTIVLYVVIKVRVSTPARSISTAMEQFAVNGEHTAILLPQNDEFGVINQAFNKMVTDIDNYVNSISKLSHERERQLAEIEIAGKIQKGFLPPEHPDFKELEINSTMIPAKYIGGDIYDFKKIDDTHYYLMIADVAGKGLSASLYMAVMLTNMRQFALNNPNPSLILRQANNYLAAKNPESVFLSAFVAVYSTTDNTLTYSSAGHNPPYILGKRFQKLDKANGTVLGLFENEEYANEAIRLEPDDMLFLYTDGITEALNRKKEFYTEERLEALLRDYHGGDLIGTVLRSLKGFVLNTEQSDDITMVSVRVRNENELDLKGTIAEFEQIKELLLQGDIPEDDRLPLCLAAEEIYSNICAYGYGPEETARKVHFTLQTKGDIVMTFRDNGTPYNPLEDMLNDDDIADYDPENEEGGLGKYIAFNIADDVKYNYTNNENTLEITKRRKES